MGRCPANASGAGTESSRVANAVQLCAPGQPGQACCAWAFVVKTGPHRASPSIEKFNIDQAIDTRQGTRVADVS